MTYEAEEVGAAALGSFANSDPNTDASEVAELAKMALEDAAPEMLRERIAAAPFSSL